MNRKMTRFAFAAKCAGEPAASLPSRCASPKVPKPLAKRESISRREIGKDELVHMVVLFRLMGASALRR
jgi:hypothetical protein